MSLSSEAGAKRQRASQVINIEMGARRATKSELFNTNSQQIKSFKLEQYPSTEKNNVLITNSFNISHI